MSRHTLGSIAAARGRKEVGESVWMLYWFGAGSEDLEGNNWAASLESLDDGPDILTNSDEAFQTKNLFL